MKQAAIVVMAKEPQAGYTKTRLSPPLTHQQAAALYEALLLDTLAMLVDLDWADLAVAFSPASARAYFEAMTPPGVTLLPVEGADIGECLQKALDCLLKQGYPRVIALNADGPTLPSGYLHQAITLLEDHDIVLGEGHDGGYYLVGAKEDQAILFENIAWSTDVVLRQTLGKAEKVGLSVALTPIWHDVDTIQDLKRLQEELRTLPVDRLVHTRRILADLGGIESLSD